ncbi:MAG: YfaZ family outer membrane protein [Acidobacteria bacterium]|nr:YfaZ family outer membrane protein [Acidobacteriota bacterium]
MTKCSLKVLLPCLVVILVAAVTVSPAYAQYRPMPAPGSASASQKGESYHVEISANLWSPDPVFVVSSDSLGVAGTTINAQGDLGIVKKQIYDIRIVLKPATRHKFRFAYLPLAYTSTAAIDATIYFNGRQYPVNAQIASDLQWKTYRFGYEYDFVSTKSGFFGVVLEAKVTQAQIQLNSVVGNEFAKAQAPIPAIGAIGRVYLAPGFSITGEYTYFKLPSSLVKDTIAHYTEYDFYTTFNVTNNLGAQAGYRKINIGVTVTNVHGSAMLSGPYFGGVVRF